MGHGKTRWPLHETFVVYPESKKKTAAVVIIHEIFGLTDWVQDLADQVAAAGYIAIAPDLLSGMAPNGGRTSAFAQWKRREAISSPTRRGYRRSKRCRRYGEKTPSRERQAGGGRLLLGRRTILPLRHQSP